MKRRQFIQLASAAAALVAMPSIAARAAAVREVLTSTRLIEKLPENTKRTWLGKAFWGNRLQDWQLSNGKIECLRSEKSFEMRTVSLLTRSLNTSHTPARISAHVGKINNGDADPSVKKGGFCGFLLGAGKGKLDYKGSALIQRFSGDNGGFMAVIDDSGELSFRDFTDKKAPLNFEKLQRKNSVSLSNIDNIDIALDCHIDPVSAGKFDVRFIARNINTGEELGFIVRTAVNADELQGGLMLVSSPPANEVGARWWFDNIAAGGDKISHHRDRELGPVMGCMHSLNRHVLKMTAQFMPISLQDYPAAQLEYKPSGQDKWIKGPVSQIEDGFVALFRLDKWDPSKTYDYRILFSERSEVDQVSETLFAGQILKDPEKDVKIALYSCIIPTSTSLDRDFIEKLVPEEKEINRYTPANILFPHTTLVTHCDSHQPDLYVFCGDQYYETYPTRYGRESKDAKLDTLYRWYLWYWAFRDSIRSRPAIMLADDHDVLQGNLWGQAGIGSELPKEQQGGFKWGKELVRMVYRCQHGHNPDAYDATPIMFDIPVTYGSFVYGGVSFAVIEDRKFKSAPDYTVAPSKGSGELLGERQETFLHAWAKMDEGLPKICLTASIWGSPQTEEGGKSGIDHDSNGYPPDGRMRAVQLLKRAGALALAGDQHLGLVARQGIDAFDDGPMFFAGPAAAAFWQRWFEGKGRLPNQVNNDPNTGNFIDPFGNKMRVLAVANPKLTFDEFTDDKKIWGRFIADNTLKSEGYGIISVNSADKSYELACWPWQAEPSTGRQFSGWPITAKFDKPHIDK